MISYVFINILIFMNIFKKWKRSNILLQQEIKWTLSNFSLQSGRSQNEAKQEEKLYYVHLKATFLTRAVQSHPTHTLSYITERSCTICTETSNKLVLQMNQMHKCKCTHMFSGKEKICNYSLEIKAAVVIWTLAI